MIRTLALAIVFAFVFSLGAQLTVRADPPVGPIPAGFLPFLGGGKGVPYATPSDPPVMTSPAAVVPARFLPFLGGGEGIPYATPSAPSSQIPAGFLPFLGGGEGAPYATATP